MTQQDDACDDVAGQLQPTCPDWCVTDHDACTGEDNWVHVSAPLYVTRDVMARICTSVDPESGTVDGPHVLIGDTEYSPAEAHELGKALTELTGHRPDQT